MGGALSSVGHQGSVLDFLLAGRARQVADQRETAPCLGLPSKQTGGRGPAQPRFVVSSCVCGGVEVGVPAHTWLCVARWPRGRSEREARWESGREARSTEDQTQGEFQWAFSGSEVTASSSSGLLEPGQR